MTDWNKPDGLKAFEIIGPVEWDGHECGKVPRPTPENPYRLPFWIYDTSDKAGEYPEQGLDAHIATCILNDAAEKWLVERGSKDYPGIVVEIGSATKDDPTYTIIDIEDDDMFYGKTKSAALIAAVLAVHASNPRPVDDN